MNEFKWVAFQEVPRMLWLSQQLDVLKEKRQM
jgi:hypothetical protein